MSENKSKSSSDTGTNTSNPNNNINPSADTLDFVKNLWGGMQVPGVHHVAGMSIPTLSVQDLDKKIEDLRTVESWLQVNMSMLRSTIQMLEVQRTTLVALQSISATLTDTSQQSTVEKHQLDVNSQFAQPAIWLNMLQDQLRVVLSSVVADTSESGAVKVAAPKPKSGKKSAKMQAKTASKTTSKTATPHTTSKKTVG